MADILIATLMLIGGFFMLVAAIGVLRFADLFQRLHASSKAATLGVACILLAAALHSGALGVGARALMALLFFVLTAPVGAHLIARAAYHRGEPLAPGLLSNDLAADDAAEPIREPAPEQ